jgi:hypothetical protein
MGKLTAAQLLVCFLAAASWAAPSREHTYVSFDVSPDGNLVVFTPADEVGGGLYLLDMRTRFVRQLTQVKGRTFTPAFSPDGSAIVYAAAGDADGPFHLFLYSFSSQQVSPITHDPTASDLFPSFSSDGSTIVFARAYLQRPYSMGGLTWDDWDVCTIACDGSQLRRRTEKMYYQLDSPRFTAGDTQIVYSASSIESDDDDPGTLHRVGLQPSKAPTRLALPSLRKACGSQGSELHVARDGRGITFIADGGRCYEYDVYVGDEGVSKVRPLGVTKHSRYNRFPVFRPATNEILYLAGTEYTAGNRSLFSLYTVGIDGSKPRPIAGPQLFDAPLRWRGE